MDIFSCEAGPRLTEEVLVVDERGKGGGIYVETRGIDIADLNSLHF